MSPSNGLVVVVRGGWEVHEPIACTDRFLPALRDLGFEIAVHDSLDVYSDEPLMRRTRLIVHCWTLGDWTASQLNGLSSAVRSGVGLAGWHGGILDSCRTGPGLAQIVGGVFVAHPGDERPYSIEPVPDRRGHPIMAGMGRIDVRTEQYWLLTDTLNDVLATTSIPPDSLNWHSPINVPVVWTRRWGEGRVFVCSVGHRLADLEQPSIATIVERGLQWAAGC